MSALTASVRRVHYSLTRPALVANLPLADLTTLYQTGRIPVETEKAGWVALTPGVLDEAARLAYSFGYCFSLAVELHLATGLRIGHALRTDGWSHGFLALEDGRCLDVNGVSEPSRLWERVRYFSKPSELAAYFDEFAPALYPSSRDLAVAQTYVEPLLRRYLPRTLTTVTHSATPSPS